MALKKENYKDVQLYSSFPYIREVGKGTVASDSYAGFNTSRAMPSGVKNFPAYVRVYIEYPTGVFAPLQGMDGLWVGWTNSTIYFLGTYNQAMFDTCRIHYFVYDRLTV